MEGFGQAKFGGNNRQFFKLKDGESVFRIIGPIADNAEDGIWHKYWEIHYGYKNSQGKMRVFQSPQVYNQKTKMVEVEDPALLRIKKLVAELETAKKNKDAAKIQALEKLVGSKNARFNLDKNHYYNVVDLQGNVGVLKIRHRAKLALDAAIKSLRDSGVEPISPDNGRFFVFSRTGTGRDTVYQVRVYKKTITTEQYGEVQQDVVHTITPELARRMFTVNKDGSYNYKEAANLLTLFKKPTAEEVKRIVEEGEKAVDEILDRKAVSDDSSDYDGGSEDETTTAPAAVETKEQTTSTTKKSTKSVKEIENATVEVVTPAATKAPEVTAEAPKTTDQAVSEQSDAEFLKSLGL